VPHEARAVEPTPAAVGTITHARRTLVVVIAVLLVIASAFEIVRDGDHWPLSSYSMFAELRTPDVRLKRLYGVHDGREVELVVPLHVAPFHEARLMTALRRLGRRDDGADARRAALRAILERYEGLRVAHEHDGPALDGLRFYELSWARASGAANRDAPSRRLIAEVAR
jgi:hypothetical protein